MKKSLIRIYRFLRKFSTIVRMRAYAFLGIKLGKDVVIVSGARISYPQNLKIGDRTWVGHGTIISAKEKITIGKDCRFAPYCAVYDSNHQMPMGSGKGPTTAPIKIGNGCWLGLRAIVLSGVTIGNNVTVGAGSVVTKDVSDNSIVVGSPARVIGRNKKK